MVDRVFCRCSERLIQKLEKVLEAGEAVNMEAQFSQLTLDVIGLSVFNYDFDSLTSDSPVIEAVYTALKETESRSTDILPYWQVSEKEYPKETQHIFCMTTSSENIFPFHVFVHEAYKCRIFPFLA